MIIDSSVKFSSKKFWKIRIIIDFTNFHVNIKALSNYGIRKMNTHWVRDWLFAQFWPQIFELRIDLLRFLLSGAALGFEKRKGPPSEGLMAHFWRGICALFWFFGFGWGRHLRVKWRSRLQGGASKRTFVIIMKYCPQWNLMEYRNTWRSCFI